MGYSKYVGRIGALAVALGVGAAVTTPAGIAWAESGATDSTPPSATTGSGSAAAQSPAEAPKEHGVTTDEPDVSVEIGHVDENTPGDADEADAGTDGKTAGKETDQESEEGTDDGITGGTDEAGGTDAESPDSSESADQSSDGADQSSNGGASAQTPGHGTDGGTDAPTAVEPSPPSSNGNDDGSGDSVDAPSSTDPARTEPTKQSSEGASDTSDDESPAAETVDGETATVAFATAPTPHANTRPAVASPLTFVNAVLDVIVRPILSQLLNAIPGDPATSPLGWLLLAAARRQLGIAEPTAATQATALTSTASLPSMVLDVLFGTPVAATGAVTGQIVTGDGLTYTVSTPPGAGKLVFDRATATFTYTPTTAQRIAAALSGNAVVAMTVTVSDGVTKTPAVVNIPIGAYPLGTAADIGGGGGAHAVAVSGNRAYITNKAAGTVTVIDTTSNAVIRTITVGSTVDAIAVKPDGTRLVVSSTDDNTVKVINTSTGAVVKTIKVTQAGAITMNSTGSTLYVASGDTGTLKKISMSSWSASTVKLPTGSNPTGIVVSPDNKKIYVITTDSAGGGSVAVIASTSTGSTTVAGFASAPTALAISVDSKRLYITSADGRLSVIDTATKTIVGSYAVNGTPAAIAVSKDGSTLLITDAVGAVSAVDAATGELLGSVATGNSAGPVAAPPSIAQSADGTLLYVTDGNTVHVVTLPPTNSVPVAGPPVFNPPSSPSGIVTGNVAAQDADNDAMKYTVTTRPTKGKVTVNANGTFTYTPTAAARHEAAKVDTSIDAATDTFTVTVTDAKGATTTTEVTVAILPANKVPVVKATVNTPSSSTGAVTGRVSATDGDNDVRTYTTISSTTKGVLTFNSQTGAFTYTPTAEARHEAAKAGATADAKTDTFTVSVDDGHGGVVVKTITVTIRAVNAKPTNLKVGSSTSNNITGVITGALTATDGDNDQLTYTATGAKKGVLTMQPDGTFTYTPTDAARAAAAKTGATTATKTDTVVVTVTDGYGGTTTITLTLKVAPALPPTGGGYQAGTPSNAIGTVTGNVTAVEGQNATVTYALGVGPTKGLVQVDPVTGAFVYVPNIDARYAAANTPGTDTDMFSVTVTDAAGQQTSVTVTVEVAPPLATSMDQRSTTIAVTVQEMYFFTQADTNKAFDLLQQMGVTNIRILVPWMGVEFLNDFWSWDGVDRMVNGAYSRNIEVLAVLNSPPVWASVPNVPILTGRPASNAEFAEYAGMVAKRYKGKISAYEIWNEPNYAGFWAPGPNAAQYTELLKAAYPVIKAADPNAVVVAGAVSSVIDFLNITESPVRFVKEMYAAGAGGYFDALSFHPYLYSKMFSKGGSTVNAPLWQANEIYKLMVANGDGNKKIWATEYGQPSQIVSEQSQADYIADFLRKWRTLTYAGPAFIQTIKDNTETDENAANMGLFHTDWTPKVAVDVLMAIIEENRQLLLGL